MPGKQSPEHAGSIIRDQRKLRSMKQSELATLVGVSQMTVSRWESGEREVPALEQLALALVFGVDVDRLFPRRPASLARSA